MAMTESSTRIALTVLGMHRSGTSALARAAILRGAAGPATPLPAAADNPRGFWESKPVVDLNDAILAACGARWDDWARIEPERLMECGAPFAPRMRGALTAEFGDAPLFVLKDPRLCRLLALWEPVFAEMGIVPVALIALRAPAAVARSLAARDGFAPEHGLLLWLRYMLEAERRSRGWHRAFVAYEALLADPADVLDRAGRRLGIEWPVPAAAAAAVLDEFLDASRLAAQTAPLAVDSAYAEVWLRHAGAAFAALAQGGVEAEACSALDRVAAQFEDACRLFAPAPRPVPPPPRSACVPAAPKAPPDLGAVTLCAADSRAPALTARALARSVAACDFAETVFFTDGRVRGPFRVEPIAPLAGREAYSAFLLRGLARHIHTRHALVVQWDGYVVEPGAWEPAFLDYDYIGAPWGRFDDGMDVGNGGFSLRSKRLLEALAAPRFEPAPEMPEDVLIGRIWRGALERDFGIRFAPPEVALRFAYERVLSVRPSFGFHGLFNLWRHEDDAGLEAIACLVPEAVVARREFAELVALCFTEGRERAVRALGKAWRARCPEPEIAAALGRVLKREGLVSRCRALFAE